MKIEQLEITLNEWLEKDLKDKNELENRRNELKDELSTLVKEKEQLLRLEKQYNFLKSLSNKRRKRYYLPFLEIALIAMSLIFITAVSIPLTLIMFLMVLNILLSMDIYSIITNNYSKICGDEKVGLNKIFSVLQDLGKTKEEIEVLLVQLDLELFTIEGKISDCKNIISRLNVYLDELSDEISYIQGNINGLSHLRHRHKIEEIMDTQEIVRFVENKKQLKKKPI